MLRRRGKIWYFQCKIGGVSKTWSTGETSKRLAERKVPELMQQALLLRKVPPGSSQHLHHAIVAEVARIETDVSQQSAKRAASALRTFAEWVGKDIAVAKIDQSMLIEYMRYRVKDGRSKSTIEKEIAFLIRMVRNSGLAITKPKVIAAPRTRNRRFTDDELVKFFNASTERFRPLWLVLLATGCRLSDMVPSVNSAHEPVLKAEVDLDRRVITVRPSKFKPNETPLIRRVAIPEALVPVLKKQIASTPKKYPYLFEMLWKAGRSFGLTLDRAKLEKRNAQGKLTIHSFRATYLTKVGEIVNNAWLLKEIAGHKDIRTTQIYCQPTAPVVPINMLDFVGNRNGHGSTPSEGAAMQR